MPVTRVSGLPLPAVGTYTPFVTSVAPGGRYLLDQKGNPFLVNGDSQWSLADNLSAANQAIVLADRQANGFNTMLTDLVGSNTMTGRGNGSNWNGELPFTGGNFSTPNNTYWNRIDTFFALCQQYGQSVFVIPVDSYAIVGGPFSGWSNANGTTIGNFLGARYPAASYPGLVWMCGNDYSLPGSSNTQYEAMLTGIRNNGGTTLTTTEFESSDDITTDTGDATFLAFNNINWVYDYTCTYDPVLRAYAAATLPAILGEAVYENTTLGAWATTVSTPFDLRKQVGWTMTSGACGYFYGNDTLWTYGGAAGNQITGTLDTISVAQRKVMLNIFAGISWWKLVPDTGNTMLTAGRGTQLTGRDTTFPPAHPTNDATFGHYVTGALSADGKLAAVYNPDSSTNTSVSISHTPLGTSPQVTRYDPTNGAATGPSALGIALTNPGANAAGDHDWLYVITAS